MQVVKKEEIKKEISRCYHECPFFTLEGGPGSIMVCTHPKADYHGYIIFHPDCREGLPERCPLKREQNA